MTLKVTRMITDHRRFRWYVDGAQQSSWLMSGDILALAAIDSNTLLAAGLQCYITLSQNTLLSTIVYFYRASAH